MLSAEADHWTANSSALVVFRAHQESTLAESESQEENRVQIEEDAFPSVSSSSWQDARFWWKIRLEFGQPTKRRPLLRKPDLGLLSQKSNVIYC